MKRCEVNRIVVDARNWFLLFFVDGVILEDGVEKGTYCTVSEQLSVLKQKNSSNAKKDRRKKIREERKKDEQTADIIRR